MDAKVRIAIIDSGIDSSIYDLKDYVVWETGYSLDEKQKINEKADMEVSHKHGTAIALIIKHLCKNVEFISMNILDNNLLSDGRLLIHAFKKALELNPDIIHLSLGTKKWRYKWALKRLVKESTRKNILVVSAMSNDGAISYPSFFRDSIKVKMADIKSPYAYGYREGIFYAPVASDGIEGMGELGDGVGGNSTAAGYISGHIAYIKSVNRTNDLSKMLWMLRYSAKNSYSTKEC